MHKCTGTDIDSLQLLSEWTPRLQTCTLGDANLEDLHDLLDRGELLIASFHQLDVWHRPALVEVRFQRAVEAERREPRLTRYGRESSSFQDLSARSAAVF